MFKKILSLILAIALLPVVYTDAFAQDYVFALPETESYIFYKADGDNSMSDFFDASSLGDSVSGQWQMPDGEADNVFSFSQVSGGSGASVSIPLKNNIEDKSRFTLKYDINIQTLGQNTKFYLPDSNSYLYISNGALRGLIDIEYNVWYSVTIVKNGTGEKISVNKQDGSAVCEFDYTSSSSTASGISFAYSDSQGEGSTVYLDNFVICSNTALNSTQEYTPRYYSVFYGAKEDEYSVKSMLGTNVVFTCDTHFYANGAKRQYSQYSVSPIRENEKIFLPPSFFAAAVGKTYSYGKIDDIDVTDCIKAVNDEDYIDTAMASELLGLYVYEDERGFVVAGDTECNLSNSMSPFEIKESADSVYRYMYFDRADAARILSLASKSRPRILTNESSLLSTLSYVNSDATMQNWKQDIIAKADAMLSLDCVEYELVGVRLLSAAQTVLSRCAYLASAYYLTGNATYAARGIEEMLSACSWSDWNVSQHYLDNSELCYAMAIGFDTFYDHISKEDKAYIIERTTELSLAVSVSAYQGTFADMGSEWRYASGNWGAVCAGGMTAALISFAGEEWGMCKDTQSYLLSNAMHSIEYPAMLYYPDGSWSEGTSYWEYTTEYFVGAFLGSLYFSTGSTWGFLRPEGISECLNGFMYLQSESSGTFNFADSTNGFSKSPAGFIFAKLTDDSDAMASWKSFYSIATSQGNPYAVLWYEPSALTSSALPKDTWLRSAGAGIMKEKWHDTEAAYVGIKGGQNHTNHDNLDLGSFIFDALGQRWAMELGKDSYNIEGGYWGLAGYELYVKRPEGQNCLVINPEKGDTYGEYYQQKLDSFASVCEFVSKDKGAYMSLDLADANSRDVDDYIRGYYFADNRKSLIIQDELTLKDSDSTLYWSMHTQADITIDQDGCGATLTMGEKSLRVTVDTNADLTFSKSAAVALPGTVVRDGEYSRDHINKLLLSGTGSGEVYITVKLTPEYDYIALDDTAHYTPISGWSVEDGELIEDIIIYPLGESGRMDANSPIDFCAYMPFDCDSCYLVCDDEVICSFADVKMGKNRLRIPAGTIDKIGDATVRLRAESASIVRESMDIPVHFYRSAQRTLVETIDFEKEAPTDDKTLISSQYNIENITTKDISTFSTCMKNGTQWLRFYTDTKVVSGLPYIRKSIPTVSCGVAVFEFDVMTEHTGAIINFETRSSDRSYASFEEEKSTTPILNRYGKLGNKESAYAVGSVCHIQINLDLSRQTYCVRANGETVSDGMISISDLVYMGLNLGSSNTAGSSIFIDNMSVYARCVTDDITDNAYIFGFHTGTPTPYTAYAAYYKDEELVHVDIVDDISDCATIEFTKKSIDADSVKTMIFTENLIPLKYYTQY